MFFSDEEKTSKELGVAICHVGDCLRLCRAIRQGMREKYGIDVGFEENAIPWSQAAINQGNQVKYGERKMVLVLSKKFFGDLWINARAKKLITEVIESRPRYVTTVWFEITKNEIMKYSSVLAEIDGVVADRYEIPGDYIALSEDIYNHLEGFGESEMNVAVTSLKGQLNDLQISNPEAAAGDIPSDTHDNMVAVQRDSEEMTPPQSSQSSKSTAASTNNKQSSTTKTIPKASSQTKEATTSSPTTEPSSSDTSPSSDQPSLPQSQVHSLQNTERPAPRGIHTQPTDHDQPRITNVSDLTANMKDELATYLDVEIRTVKNWRHLASHLRLDRQINSLELEYKKDNGSPTRALLVLEASNNNCTIEHLKQIIGKMNRRDVLKVFDKHNL